MPQLDDIRVWVLTFVLAGVLLGIGIYTTKQVGNEFADLTFTNDSINFASNNTFYDFGGRPVQTVTMVANRTVALSTISYDWNENQIRIYTNASSANGGANISTGTYNVSFTYEGSTEHRVIQNATKGGGNFASFWPVIGTVLAGLLVIALITKHFVEAASV